MRQFIHSTLHPAIYHGHTKKAPFFEGWYFKLVSADETRRYAIIPGVSLSGDAHAFVQVLDGVTGQSAYHSYPLTDFWASEKDFEVRIGPNLFTRERIVLDINRPEGQVHGELRFLGVTPWPVSPTSPGIMGWYAWMPKMECYHGVVSLNHTIVGRLRIDGRDADFGGGLGYIEKDWGKAFPAAWVWFQTNHFDAANTCITASVAIIPWVRRSFPGFIIGVWHNRLLYRFASYTGARIETAGYHRRPRHLGGTQPKLSVGDGGNSCRRRLAGWTNPARYGQTCGRNPERYGGRALKHRQRPDAVQWRGRHAGLEVHGDLERLMALQG